MFSVTRKRLPFSASGPRAPRAAAAAGIVFSVLLTASYFLVWLSIPANPEAQDLALISHSKTISLALNLLPFAGVAFLWFIAVVRNRLGALGFYRPAGPATR